MWTRSKRVKFYFQLCGTISLHSELYCFKAQKTCARRAKHLFRLWYRTRINNLKQGHPVFFFFLFVFSRDASLAKASREARAQCAAWGALETTSDAIVKDISFKKIFFCCSCWIYTLGLDIFWRDSKTPRDREWVVDNICALNRVRIFVLFCFAPSLSSGKISHFYPILSDFCCSCAVLTT